MYGDQLGRHTSPQFLHIAYSYDSKGGPDTLSCAFSRINPVQSLPSMAMGSCLVEKESTLRPYDVGNNVPF